MSKRIFAIAGVVLVVVSAVVISCKKDEHEEKTKEMKLTWDVSNPVARASMCDRHGGAVGFNLEWELATCRSNCTRGLGFRCGHKFTVFCADGFFQDDIHKGSCPNAASAYDRVMAASPTFYTDGSVKLTFLRAVPAEDRTNTNFEIEAEEMITIPDGVLLNGVAYKGFMPKLGIFTVNYSDGPYGSVTLPATLIPK